MEELTSYIWRVRYRDKELNWSAWSDPKSFTTGESIVSNNLLLNSGAENDLDNWEIVEGVVEALEEGVCDGLSPYSGGKYFIAGGLCEHSEVGRAIQKVDINMYADSIDAGAMICTYGGFLSNFSGNDLPEIDIAFIDENCLELGKTNSLSSLSTSWVRVSEWATIPKLTRMIRVQITGTRNNGLDNDSYLDDLFLKLGNRDTNCRTITAVKNINEPFISELSISSNPMISHSIVHLPKHITGNVSLYMTDYRGLKYRVIYTRSANTIIVEKGNLTTGNYIVWLRKGNRLVGKGKIAVISDN